MKHVIILGGGIGGVSVYETLHKAIHKRRDAALTLINRTNYTLYLPMLHEAATGSVSPTHITQPIREVVGCCMRFVRAEIQHFDPTHRSVVTDAGAFSYDYLVVALGSTTNFYGVPGAERYALTLHSLPDAARLRNMLLRAMEAAARAPNDDERRRLASVIIVGGGATGTEAAGQIADLFRNELRRFFPSVMRAQPSITLIEAGERLVPMLSPALSARARRRLERLGVTIALNAPVKEVQQGGVVLENGRERAGNIVLWTSGVQSVLPGIAPAELLDDRGRLRVNAALQSVVYDSVFGVGDNIVIDDNNAPALPQTAQAATKAGKHLGRTIARLLREKPPLPFSYRHRGDLVPLGNNYGLAQLGRIRFSGFFAWWLRRTVFLQGIRSNANRLRIVLDWTIQLFRPRDTSEL